MPPKRNKKKLAKRKKVVLSLHQKMEICNHLERGVSRKILMKLFNIGYSTITNIKAQEGVLRKFLSENKPVKRGEQRSTLRKGKLEKLEDALFGWYKTSRSEGSRVSRSMVKEKAKQLYEQMKIEEPCAFSNGWLARFKARHGIRCFAADQVNAVLTEEETIFHGASEIFCEYFSTLVVEHDLSADLIYSACESNLLWRSLNDAGGVHGIKCMNDDFINNIERLTALVCTNASGNHKLDVFAVGEDELSSQGDAGTSIVYNRRSIGRMDKELYIQWFETIFVPSVKLNLKNTGKSEESKVLLLLDNCVQQLLDSKLVSDNVLIVFLPTDVTSAILPMNRGVIHDFMCNYRIDVMKKLCKHEMSVQYFLSQYSISDAIFYLAGAWKSVNTGVLKKAWQHLFPNS